jgi:hypothetical protein
MLAVLLDKFEMAGFAECAAQMGSMILLCAFVLLLLVGFGMISKLIGMSIYRYFSAQQRMTRKLFFYVNKRNRLDQLFHFKKIRLFYFSQKKRKQLLLKYQGK